MNKKKLISSIALVLIPLAAFAAIQTVDSLKATSVTSRSSNPATTGVLRLSNTDQINWRNNANGANLPLKVNTSDQMIYGSGSGGFKVGSDSSLYIYDNGLTIQNSSSTTKQAQFSASGITAGTTRTMTIPDVSGTLTLNDATQTITNKTISGSSNTITNVSLTSGVTGTLPIANGGTGTTTANGAFNALAPSQATNSGKFLTTNGTDTSWATVDLTSLIAKSTLTAKGDILTATASGTPAVLPVSTDGYLVQADSGASTGLSYIQATSTATASKIVKWDASKYLYAVKLKTSAGDPAIDVDSSFIRNPGNTVLADFSGGYFQLTQGFKFCNSTLAPCVSLQTSPYGSAHDAYWPYTNVKGIMTNDGAGQMAWTPTPSLGTAGATAGTLGLSGATSGTVTIKTAAAAGTYDFILPTSLGSSGQVLTSAGSGSTPTWQTPSSSTPAYAVANKTTTYTATTSDEVITVDTSGGAWTLTLYTASGNTGRALRIKKTTSDANALTIDGNSTETIDGALTLKIINQYEEVTIVSNGTNWIVTGRVNDLIKALCTASSATSMVNGAETIINFNSCTYDPLSMITTGASWKATVPVNGTYKVCFNIMGVESTWPGANYSMYTRLYKNNSAHSYVTFVEVASTSTHSVSNNGCYTIKLVATDYIDLRASQNSGADRNTETAYSGLVWVSVEKIGAY